MKIIGVMKFIFFLLAFNFAGLFGTDGITYTSYNYPSGNLFFNIFKQVRVHLLEINPKKFEIKIAKALNNGVGRESVLSIAKRTGAIAAINGGFFSFGEVIDGLPAGALKIHDWYSLPYKFRGCIGWSNKDIEPIFDNISAFILCRSKGKLLIFNGLNTLRGKEDAILFLPNFHPTTLTSDDGEEIVLNKKNKVIEIIKDKGNAIIPEEGKIISIQKDHPLYGKFKLGNKVNFHWKIVSKENKTKAEKWNECEYIVGGTPMLIFKGKQLKNFLSESVCPSFLTKRHSRTAIGILPNKNWLFVVIESKWFFSGMTINELAQFMEELGCIYALNLDGGRSSSFVYKNELKNSPGGEEFDRECNNWIRKVTDAVIVIPKKI